MIETYTFSSPCELVRMKDGDTFSLLAQVHGEVDIPMLGLSTDMSFPVPIVLRLEGVNAPEKNTVKGQEAIAWVMQWFETVQEQGKPLNLHTNGKLDSFGRWLGDLRLSPIATRGLARDLLESGHAETYTRHGSW